MDFMSVWRMHRIVVSTAPHNEIGIMIGATDLIDDGCIIAMRNIPYAPNFSKILASTMEPAAGAST